MNESSILIFITGGLYTYFIILLIFKTWIYTIKLIISITPISFLHLLLVLPTCSLPSFMCSCLYFVFHCTWCFAFSLESRLTPACKVSIKACIPMTEVFLVLYMLYNTELYLEISKITLWNSVFFRSLVNDKYWLFSCDQLMNLVNSNMEIPNHLLSNTVWLVKIFKHSFS